MMAAMIGETFGLRHMGSIYGSVVMLAGFGGAVGPLMTGYIYDVTNGYSLAFIIGGIMALVAALALYFVRAPKLQ